MFYPCNPFIRNRVYHIKPDDAPYAESIALDIWDTHQIEFKSLKQAKNELITGLAYHLEIR